MAMQGACALKAYPFPAQWGIGFAFAKPKPRTWFPIPMARTLGILPFALEQHKPAYSLALPEFPPLNSI